MATGKAPSILIVPATSYEIDSDCGRKPKTPKKTPIVCGAAQSLDGVGASFYDPRNFLVRGGQRAFEQKILSMNKNAIQELRAANSVLAEELLRERAGAEEVRDKLREKECGVEALHAAIERLERARKAQDKKHLLQLKELNRRYKEEQAQRLTLESERTQLKASREAVERQVEALQEERAQLMDLLNAQRNNCSRLEATIAADAATIAELRSRAQATDTQLADEVAARQELFARHKALEADFTLVSERHSALAASNSELEGRLRAASSQKQLLEDEVEAARKALQAEKAACAAERQHATSLQFDLTQLQSASQLAAAAAAADQVELERLRGQTEQLKAASEGLREDVARLREEVLHLTAQGVAAQASAQQLQQERDQAVQQREEAQQQREELQQQLVATRESLERRIQQLEAAWRDDSAARARAAQEAETAMMRGHGEELAARQRAWDGQLRAREKAWEEEREALQRTWDGQNKARERAWAEEREAMQRAQEEELARKDQELLVLRERMREAQSSVAELAAEVATFKFQAERYAAVFRENEDLKQRLAQAEETIRARDAALEEAAASQAAQLELWKAEANEVAQAAAKWKQRCTALQGQLEAKDTESQEVDQEARSLAGRLSMSETERVKLQEAMASMESRLALVTQEANSYRLQLSEVLASHQSSLRQAEVAQQELHLRDLQELEAKRRALDDLSDQLNDAERGRAAAQAEAAQLREKVALLSREVNRAKALADAAAARTQSLGAAAVAALGAGEGLRRGAPQQPQQQYQAGGPAGAVQRLLELEHEAEERERALAERRGSAGGRGIGDLELEAESWFSSLEETPQAKAPAPAPAPGPPRQARTGLQLRWADTQQDGRAAAPTPQQHQHQQQPPHYHHTYHQPQQHQPQPQPRQQLPQQHQQPQTSSYGGAAARSSDTVTGGAAPAAAARAYDVTISPSQGSTPRLEDMPGMQVPPPAGFPHAQPPPQPSSAFRQQPPGALQHAGFMQPQVQPGSAAAAAATPGSMGVCGAAAAAAGTYTAVGGGWESLAGCGVQGANCHLVSSLSLPPGYVPYRLGPGRRPVFLSCRRLAAVSGGPTLGSG
ncbi:hypothetical protein Agub_g8728 [Astrephomene gubernaculifera]|uniref:Uncharacterized protein n=1 Tax=Astrephomene gubernaculifera TaxID=47775 RepID=A0AAD3HND6_9CHLO|nr:hypothetical protein Agub_g8728 [Astrephomene gubernaculifera]